ncbi:thioredoxin [Echinicola jeungdonensis]|uniref:Thioredoxin n=1 Tax=Echinicola jeungdonensis TaxID=709343 RepID=A0ABV5J5Z2_9BACT|nr:thioredoxin [Echinicola jeungdonensis]MDN3670055.1 thioredoxin [Echinicola jeungdonensis]
MKTFKELISGDQLVLVDFFATWCGPCKAMPPILKEVVGQVGNKVKVIKVDVDKNPAAASQFQIRGIPTLILFQKGTQLWRKSGVPSVQELLTTIESHYSKTSA